MKVFISQPMRGKSDEQILRERKEAIEEITKFYMGKDSEIEIIDSFIQMSPPNGILEDQKAVWYLSKSIEKLSEADAVIFLSGWNKARGCRIEELIANTYGKECFYMGSKDRFFL